MLPYIRLRRGALVNTSPDNKCRIDKKISDNEFQQKSTTISHSTPVLKESYYYRKVLDSYFGKNEKLIPHFWMPKWTDVIDPSARELQDYRE